MLATVRYLLSLYRKIKNSILSASCRYYPTCSEYAEEALEKHGPILGTYLALKRLIRCNQFFKGGYDPVPPR